jgi:hypothetical protein
LKDIPFSAFPDFWNERCGYESEKITHSVDCATTNTAKLLRENWATGYCAKGKQRNDPVENGLENWVVGTVPMESKGMIPWGMC